jgi:hypothetical protein
MELCVDWGAIRAVGRSAQSSQLNSSRGATGSIPSPINPVKARLRRSLSKPAPPTSPIFVCHASADRPITDRICTALRKRGLVLWMSSRDVRPGENYQEEIVRAIHAAKVMILIFTANANASDEIKKELALAAQRRLMVIPIRIANIEPNAALSYELSTRQWIELFKDRESAMKDLVTRLIDITAAQPEQTIEAMETCSWHTVAEARRAPLLLIDPRKPRPATSCGSDLTSP